METDQGSESIHWSPRIGRGKIRQLYLLDAQGIVNEELIDEVSTALAARCRDILTIRKAKYERKVLCPACDSGGEETLIPRLAGLEELIRCPHCGWQVRWLDYLRATKRRQLNAGGAVKAFEGYLRRFEAARTPQEKTFAIDQLIHAFHFSFRELPNLPTRPVGANLIRGSLSEVIELLDELSFRMPTVTKEQPSPKEDWDQNLRIYQQVDWTKITAERRERREAEERSETE